MNLRKIIIVWSFCFPVISFGQQKGANSLKIWFDKPASIWEEALPLGNARTGAMVFGGVSTERFQLNDNTLWSGYPENGNNPEGKQYLSLVRSLIFAGDYDSATKVWKKMQGPYSARYLTMADLFLQFPISDTVTKYYYRDLDLANAISSVRYEQGGVQYKRETFISHPDRVMVIRITADKKSRINFTTRLTSKLKYRTSTSGKDLLVLTGKAPKYVANRDFEPKQVVYDDWNGEGMNFEVQVKIVNEGGSLRNTDSTLVVSNADAVTIYLTNGTSFNGFNKSPGLNGKDPSAEAGIKLKNAVRLSYSNLRSRHISDYQSLFNRVQFYLQDEESKAKLSTDERLRQFNKTGNGDNGLVVLYYQFGRYLMISSTRPGSRPTNLQGIWNDHVQPPWGSNYTTNINTEMNYWLAENTNLSECHQPLFDFMKELSVNGAITAKTNYGINEGWVAHHNSDLWAKTSPPGGYEWDPKAMPRWSAWPMAGVWFSTHLWEHYQFTGDKKFLKEEAYPLMKGAAQFLLHWLITDPKTGYLVTNPSTSPENTVKISGKEYQLSMASTMDMSLARELFSDLIRASEALGVDESFRNQLKQAKEKLYPFHIGQYGQLQEWFGDWDDPADKHRHLSHLFGLYPGSQITVSQTPELAAAAHQSLDHRGDVSTGWSMAWKINWWARLKDAERAYKILSSAFTYINPAEKRETMGGGGTYPNLFDAHPPFQIDGNFGATAGITEMLLQSHEGEIEILPALPAAWKNGSIRGIKARGNFTIDMNWKNGQITELVVHSGSGGNCRIRVKTPVGLVNNKMAVIKSTTPNALMMAYGIPEYKNNAKSELLPVEKRGGFVVELFTEKGKTYTFLPDMMILKDTDAKN